jgi:hypothetical protein
LIFKAKLKLSMNPIILLNSIDSLKKRETNIKI